MVAACIGEGLLHVYMVISTSSLDISEAIRNMWLTTHCMLRMDGSLSRNVHHPLRKCNVRYQAFLIKM